MNSKKYVVILYFEKEVLRRSTIQKNGVLNIKYFLNYMRIKNEKN
jgi:hypothetical protein